MRAIGKWQAGLAAALFVLAAAGSASAQGFDLYSRNNLQKCAGTAGEGAVNCYSTLISTIKSHQEWLEKFKPTLGSIRGVLANDGEIYEGCVVKEVNGRRPNRKPSSASGGLCSAEWKQFRTAMSALLEESCVTLPFYQDDDNLTRLKDEAEDAEDDYDLCFDDRLTTVYSDFANHWGISTQEEFFATYRSEISEYKQNNLNGQLLQAFELCKAALESIRETNPGKYNSLVGFGRCS